jgi:type IV pilus assembly protein PilA
MIVVAIIGILAAIAIPNFMRYQLRSKASERKINLEAIFKAEESLRQGERHVVVGNTTTGQYWDFAVAVPAGTVGTTKIPWQPADLAIAQTIDWIVQGQTYGQYTTAVAGGTAPFGTAMSACAVTDIDGDLVLAGDALWQPVLDSAGAVTTAPPDANCAPDVTNGHATGLVFQPTGATADGIGQVVQLSADSVF